MATSEAAGIQRKVGPIKQSLKQTDGIHAVVGLGGVQEVYTS